MTFSSHRESDKREENRTGKLLRGKHDNSNRLGSGKHVKSRLCFGSCCTCWLRGELSQSRVNSKKFPGKLSREECGNQMSHDKQKDGERAMHWCDNKNQISSLFSVSSPFFPTSMGVFDCNWAGDLNKNEDKLKDFLELLTLSCYIFLQAAQQIESMFHSINVVIN